MANPRMKDQNRRTSNGFWVPTMSVLLRAGGMWRAPFSGRILTAIYHEGASGGETGIASLSKNGGANLITVQSAPPEGEARLITLSDSNFSVGDVFLCAWVDGGTPSLQLDVRS